MTAVGLTLQPDEDYLGLLEPLLHRAVDYFEVAPETTWWAPPEAAAMTLVPNGFHRRFRALAAATGAWFVGHGVGLSLGGGPSDAARRRVWLAQLERDQAVFDYRWYSDHLGVSAPGGLAATLPLPLLMDEASVRRVAGRLLALRRFLPLVGVENTAQYFLLGEPLDEARFLRRLLRRGDGRLVLDLHNLHTMAENLGFDPAAYLDELDLGQVIELHVSGGSYSEAGWLPAGRTLRLDSHDQAVPEAVFRLCEQVAPRCPNLRGITLERMEGTVALADVAAIAEELGRLRRIAEQATVAH